MTNPVGSRSLIMIGDVSVHAHTRSFTSRTYTARGTSSDVQDSYRSFQSSSNHNLQIRRESYDILLFGNGNQTTTELAARIKRMLGTYIDLIAYTVTGIDNSQPISCKCLICDNCCTCIPLFVHNTGILKSITENAVGDDMYSLTIEVELSTPYWEAYNRMIWGWTNAASAMSRNLIEFEPTMRRNTMFQQYPGCEIDDCIHFFKRNVGDKGWLYDPFWASERHCNLPIPYIQNNVQVGDSISWTSAHRKIMLRVPEVWSAPPMALYVIRNFLNKEGVFRIKIDRDEAWRSIAEETFVSITQVNNIITDTGTDISETDILVVGDIRGFCSILDSETGDVKLNVAIAMDYVGRGSYPGYVSPYTNRIYLINNAQVEYFATYIYRML